MTSFSHEDAELAFKIVTRAFGRDMAAKGFPPMTDAELAATLERYLGIFGGSSGGGEPHVTYQGSGLKIWGSWGIHNHHTTKPVFQGAATLRMARAVYGIRDSRDQQLTLF